MKEYRIVKKYYRSRSTAEVKHYFQVQYLGYVFSILLFPRKLAWKPHMKTLCYGTDCYKRPADFDYIEDAQKYVKNLQKPVYSEEVVSLDIGRG